MLVSTMLHVRRIYKYSLPDKYNNYHNLQIDLQFVQLVDYVHILEVVANAIVRMLV